MRIKGKFQVNAGLVFSEDKVANTIDTWSDITQVTDIAGAISSTLVGRGR